MKQSVRLVIVLIVASVIVLWSLLRVTGMSAATGTFVRENIALLFEVGTLVLIGLAIFMMVTRR